MCLIAPLHGLEDLLPPSPNPSSSSTGTSTSTDPTTHITPASSFAHFMSTRCRGYVVHRAALGTLVEGRAEYGCNIYASGEHWYVECIMIRAWRDMLDWFGRLARGEEGAEEKWEMPDSGLVGGNGDGENEGGDAAGRVDEAWAPDVAA